MKKIEPIIPVMVCLVLFSCGNNSNKNSNSGGSTAEQTVSNTDGNKNSSELAEIKIGTQTWAIKNLDVSTFRNGDAILNAKTEEEWVAAGKQGKPACCYYDNDTANGTKYGKLYNWYAVNDPRGLAPEGFHIPGNTEWTMLTDFLGGKEDACTKMKSTSGWNKNYDKNGNGTNASGFAGLPGGNCYINGIFTFIGSSGFWWSSTETSSTLAWNSALAYGLHVVYANNNKLYGFSVRCLRD